MDITELKRLAEAATPQVGHACNYMAQHWAREGHVDFENADLFIATERPQEDSEYYAAVHPACVLELIAEVERLRAELADARRQLQAGWIEVCQSGADLLQKGLAEKLAASQAREKVLREKIVLAQIGSCSCGAKTPDTRYHSAFCVYSQLAGILALPADDTALREMLARAQEEMRERIAVWHATTGWLLDESDVTDAIRALEVKP